MQKSDSNRGDWCNTLNEERIKYDIVENDIEISNMSKYKFKKLINEKIDGFAIKYLQELANNHSQSRIIGEEKFERKAYFTDLFSLRKNNCC